MDCAVLIHVCMGRQTFRYFNFLVTINNIAMNILERLCYCCCFTAFIYLAGRDRKRNLPADLVPNVHSSQSWSGWSWEPGAQSTQPTWGQWPSGLSHHLAPPRVGGMGSGARTGNLDSWSEMHQTPSPGVWVFVRTCIFTSRRGILYSSGKLPDCFSKAPALTDHPLTVWQPLRSQFLLILPKLSTAFFMYGWLGEVAAIVV